LERHFKQLKNKVCHFLPILQNAKSLKNKMTIFLYEGFCRLGQFRYQVILFSQCSIKLEQFEIEKIITLRSYLNDDSAFKISLTSSDPSHERRDDLGKHPRPPLVNFINIFRSSFCADIILPKTLKNKI